MDVLKDFAGQKFVFMCWMVRIHAFAWFLLMLSLLAFGLLRKEHGVRSRGETAEVKITLL